MRALYTLVWIIKFISTRTPAVHCAAESRLPTGPLRLRLHHGLHRLYRFMHLPSATTAFSVKNITPEPAPCRPRPRSARAESRAPRRRPSQSPRGSGPVTRRQHRRASRSPRKPCHSDWLRERPAIEQRRRAQKGWRDLESLSSGHSSSRSSSR